MFFHDQHHGRRSLGQGTVVGRVEPYELCDLVVLRGEHRVVLACDQLRHALRRAHLSAEAARRSRADILRTHIRTVSPGQSAPSASGNPCALGAARIWRVQIPRKGSKQRTERRRAQAYEASESHSNKAGPGGKRLVQVFAGNSGDARRRRCRATRCCTAANPRAWPGQPARQPPVPRRRTD